MTTAELDDFLRRGFQYGDPMAKRVYVSPSVEESMRQLGDFCVDAKPHEDCDFWLLGAYGFRVPVYVREQAPPGFAYVADAASVGD